MQAALREGMSGLGKSEPPLNDYAVCASDYDPGHSHYRTVLKARDTLESTNV
jgi:hypothetical protein